LDTVEFNNNQYIVVLPVEKEEVVILRIELIGKEENFVAIEDENELNMVFKEFKERNKEKFSFD